MVVMLSSRQDKRLSPNKAKSLSFSLLTIFFQICILFLCNTICHCVSTAQTLTIRVVYYNKIQTNPKLSVYLDSSIQSNTFSMKRVASTNAPTIIVNFTPIQASINLDHHDLHIVKSHPIFNNDHHFFTPSFMLDQDKIKMPKNLEVFKDMHQTRVAQANQQKEQFYLPKPSKTNSYCSVCKIHYEDYLMHLNEEAHIQKTEKSKFKKDIDRLCKTFMAKTAKKEKVAKTKTIKKQKGKATPSNKCQEPKESMLKNEIFICGSNIQCQL